MSTFIVKYTKNSKPQLREVSVESNNPVKAISKCMELENISFGDVLSCEPSIRGMAAYKGAAMANISNEVRALMHEALSSSSGYYPNNGDGMLIDLPQVLLDTKTCALDANDVKSAFSITKLNLDEMVDAGITYLELW